jgi:hypothetical protein
MSKYMFGGSPKHPSYARLLSASGIVEEENKKVVRCKEGAVVKNWDKEQAT